MLNPPEDQTIVFSLFTKTPGLKDKELARRLITIILSYQNSFSPQLIDYGKGWNSVKSDFSNVYSNWGTTPTLLLKREKDISCEMVINFENLPPNFSNLMLWIEESYFEEEVHIQRFLQMSLEIYDLLHPYYGSIHQTQDAIKMLSRLTNLGKTTLGLNLQKGIPGVYWANFFRLEFVTKYESKQLMLAPCKYRKELNDGGILLITSGSPLNPSSDSSVKMRHQIRDYIGEDAFFPI